MHSEAFQSWRPTAPVEHLRLRARLLGTIRGFFAARGVLEVDTPVLSRAATTEPHLESLVTSYRGPGAPHGRRLYLHTSPEFSMKRLLAAGSGSIYQICKVFRGGELGRLHNPEFTLLEWYRLGFDHHNLMDEVEALVRECLPSSTRAGPARRMRYREAFESWAGVDPFSASPEALARCLERHGIGATVGLECSDRDAWLDLILTQIVEPRLQDEGWVFLYDYPPSQASLARVRAGNPPVAERFELYVDGIELANGFHELGDATEQRRRFEADLAQRRDRGLPVPPKDECLLAALEHGLPDCAGVALGVDRLVMVAAGAGALRDVMAFPIERA